MKLTIISAAVMGSLLAVSMAHATNLNVAYDPMAAAQSGAESAVTRFNNSQTIENANALKGAIDGLNEAQAAHGGTVSIPMLTMTQASDSRLQGYDILTHNSNVNENHIIQQHIDTLQVQAQRYNDAVADWDNNHQNLERLKAAYKDLSHTQAYLASHGVMMNGSLTVTDSPTANEAIAHAERYGVNPHGTPIVVSKAPVTVPVVHTPEVETDPVDDILTIKVNPIVVPKAPVVSTSSTKTVPMTALTSATPKATVHETATKTPVVHAQALTASTKPAAKVAPHVTATARPEALAATPHAQTQAVAPVVHQSVNNYYVNQDAVSHDEYKKTTKKLSAGIAGAMAMNGIPQVPNSKLSFGMGGGDYNGESAVSMGIVAAPVERVAVKAAVSWDSDRNAGVSAGFAVGF